MANVFEVLRCDHEQVEELLAELESAAGAADAGERRERLVQRLVIASSQHDAIEEQNFWPVVRRLVLDGGILADTAVEQEKAAQYLLDELDGLHADERRFEELLVGVITETRKRIAYEEAEVWPKLRNVLSVQETDKLGARLAETKKHAPTRPHPQTPPRPGVLKATGRFVAATDRLPDSAIGRGDA